MVAVVEGQDPVGHARWLLALLLERRGEDEVFPGRNVLGGHDPLLGASDEVVDVVEPVVLGVERVAAEAGAVSEEDAFGAWSGDVHDRADCVGAVPNTHRL